MQCITDIPASNNFNNFSFSVRWCINTEMAAIMIKGLSTAIYDPGLFKLHFPVC